MLSHEKIKSLETNLRGNGAYIQACVSAFLGKNPDADLGSSSGSTVSNISFRQGNFEYRITYKSDSDKDKGEKEVSYEIGKYRTAGLAKPKPEESIDLEKLGSVFLSSKYKTEDGQKTYINGSVEVNDLKDSTEAFNKIHEFIGEIFPTPLGV
jgi:hypothetical protein